jgi:hypothetical protein
VDTRDADGGDADSKRWVKKQMGSKEKTAENLRP